MHPRRWIAAVCFSVLSTGAAQAQIGPCDTAFEIDEAIRAMRLNIQALFGSAPEEAAETEEPRYYFTNRAGQFHIVACQGDILERQEMYPIGVVVKELGPVDIEGYRYGEPVLVLTEYGHRKIVPRADLSPIEPGHSYIFADYVGEALTCFDGPEIGSCPGHVATVCPRDDLCKYGISGTYGYAAAEHGDPGVLQATRAYTTLRVDPLGAVPQIDAAEIEEHLANLCTPFPVIPYKHGGVRHLPNGKHWLTLCDDRAEGSVGGLRVVNHAFAEAHFRQSFIGSFHRNPLPEGVLDRIEAMAGPGIIDVRKTCTQKVSQVSEATLKAGFGLGIEAGVFEVSLGAEQETSLAVVNYLRDDEMIRFAAYFVTPPGAPEENARFAIQLKAVCEGSTPTTAKSIMIIFSGFDEDDRAEILAQSEVLRTYTSDNADSESFIPLNDLGALRRGMFWKIFDHQSYFRWRDVLRNYIGDPERVTWGTLLREYDPEDRPAVRDFFVHLILAAAFYHQPPNIQEVQSHGDFIRPAPRPATH